MPMFNPSNYLFTIKNINMNPRTLIGAGLRQFLHLYALYDEDLTSEERQNQIDFKKCLSILEASGRKQQGNLLPECLEN